MSPITLSNALSAARSINRAWITWNEQDGPIVPFNGVMTKGMSSKLHHTVIDSVDATADDLGEDGKREVEPEARRLMPILDEIGCSFIGWLQGISHGLASARPTHGLRSLRGGERPSLTRFEVAFWASSCVALAMPVLLFSKFTAFTKQTPLRWRTV